MACVNLGNSSLLTLGFLLDEMRIILHRGVVSYREIVSRESNEIISVKAFYKLKKCCTNVLSLRF